MKSFVRGIGSLLIAVAMMLSSAGCQSQPAGTGGAGAPTQTQLPQSVKFTPGTYKGTGIGRLGPITAEVTFDNTSVKTIKVVSSNETKELSSVAFQRIPEAVIKNQSLAVDAVSGATFSSRGLLDAIGDAVKQAGADPEKFKNPVPKSPGPTEEYTADVCVVGAGGSGTAAAVQAARDGAKVVLLEKSCIPGGLGAQGAGLAAVESEYQKAAGIKFTKDDVYKHMVSYTNATVNLPLLRKILNNSAETISWLKNDFKWNFQFITPNIWGKEAFDTYHLNTTFGQERMKPFYDDFAKNGGKLMLETTGQKLIMKDGKVAGVQAKKADGTLVNVRSKAVILATGGAISNDEMLKQYTGSAEYEQMGYNVCTGDGIKMATEIGAATTGEMFVEVAEIGMQSAVAPDTKFNINLVASAALMHVNTQGNRYFDESLFREQPLNQGGAAVAANGPYYVILDQATIDKLTQKGLEGLLTPEEAEKQRPQFQRLSHFGVVGGVPPMFAGAAYPLSNLPAELDFALKSGWAYKADSINELAEAAKLPNLVDSVNRYKGFVAKGRDDDFLKKPLYLTPIEKGPYYAIKFLPGVFNTLGGIVINENFQALDSKKNPIPGLYVAGVDGGSMFHKPYYDICGTTMMYAYTSGRLSGEYAAKYAREN
ncbi:MAG: FAD-dependent oxidoreductase [Clostridiales bacterium]|jgi:fumarate reductase flavoprotein subunit|nr:FAD-dependent oxidoreductase [Eubacteriales bacterium]MDH7566720.1 FAD-dependent oxidoreductase [Clostridiales bacterium]